MRRQLLSRALVVAVAAAGLCLPVSRTFADAPHATSASASAPAPTPSSLNADVLVMHATNAGGGIDPRVKHLTPQLTRPPFSAYDTYKLLIDKRLPAPLGGGGQLALPDGRTLRVTYKGLAESKGDARYKVAATISDPKGKDFLPLLEVAAKLDEPFFVAGQSYDKGILVLAIKMTR
ncbi:MAG: hypothetical protein IT374_00440 [Polyangiaceae bacterium]|nr:hypothetical protein [Polyangiaceae bacterium]